MSNEVRAIGVLAHAALVRSGGRVDVLHGSGDTAYAMAAGELVWVGHGDAVLHPRAVVLERRIASLADAMLSVNLIEPWRAPRPMRTGDRSCLRTRALALRDAVVAGATPRGFGALLCGAAPPFPLVHARADVEALAQACAADDADAACEAALRLLGLGPGLTPSGDDLVGAVFFTRRLLPGRATVARTWSRAAERLVQASREHAHPIAAALFGDLVGGASFAPLHRLAAAMTSDTDASVEAARELIAIGHSSGWDMLTGFLVGLTGCLRDRAARSGHVAQAVPDCTIPVPT